jgi:lactoylglutathione lyase
MVPHMARIEHVALWARDIDAVCSFYAEYFGAQIGARYENARTGFSSRFLRFATGARIEVMTVTQQVFVDAPAGTPRLGFAHVALSVGSQAEVDATTERIRHAGLTVVDGPRRTGDGYYESVVLDPEGNRVEITG